MNSIVNDTRRVEIEETLASWTLRHRINSNALVKALQELGATEVNDLKDLQDTDIMKFKPPFLKKLEYVRFKRGIMSLKKVSNGSLVHEYQIGVHQTVSTAISAPNPSTIDSFSSIKEFQWQLPPLPPVCPANGCVGTLSLKLGTRKNKYLKGLNGPDFRWIASCSQCLSKFHCCHHLCGHLQKISSLGSSDIIRHEQGRFNRWQKKIKPPCPNNPQSIALRAGYAEEKKQLKQQKKQDSTALLAPTRTDDESGGIVGVGLSNDKNVIALRAGHAETENQSMQQKGQNNVSPLRPICTDYESGGVTEASLSTDDRNVDEPACDSEFKSILGTFDAATLNFSGVEDAERMFDDDLLSRCSAEDDFSPANSICADTDQQNSAKEKGEPGQKRAKFTEPQHVAKCEGGVDQICNEMSTKCVLSMKSACA